MEENRCTAITAKGHRCTRSKMYGDMCTQHHHRAERDRVYIENRAILFERIRREYDNLVTVSFAFVLASRGAALKYSRPEFSMDEVYEIILRDVPGLIPRRSYPPDSLAAISNDRQNIHQSMVSKQTNHGMKIIMQTPVPIWQDTLEEIRDAWGKLFTGKPVGEDIYTDMVAWYAKETCREEGDLLYRRLLDCAWSTIKAEEDLEKRKTLMIRLQQECAEATRMCCDGHINRLVNVFVGFLDEVNPVVPVGELLQQKMAQIAEEYEDTEERMIHATAVFKELNIGIEQATPWIDALSNHTS